MVDTSAKYIIESINGSKITVQITVDPVPELGFEVDETKKESSNIIITVSNFKTIQDSLIVTEDDIEDYFCDEQYNGANETNA